MFKRDEIDDKKFVDAINSCLKDYSVGDVASAVCVSVPTVRRWVNGGNLPHQAMRAPILAGIKHLVG
ncbi:MAG: hypothetical protein LiPW15_687 [Parcubacteria group bacterium LiPW_15]|nr:MAG: hypothetical protein LiPW15_687 [Parcubacteria group bacterium LiPW_15]